MKVVILASSFRHGGYCVAGKVIEGSNQGKWVRIYEDKDNHCMRTQYSIGEVLTINQSTKDEIEHQKENYFITEYNKNPIANYSFAELEALIDSPDELWDIDDSSSKCKNNRVSHSIAASYTNSLYFIKVDILKITVEKFDNHGKPEHYGEFTFNNIDYKLKITDPKYTTFSSETTLRDVLICVSLALAFEVDDKCYKLIAGIKEH